jgi:hypothetical protein
MQEVRVININNLLAGTSHIMIREASSPQRAQEKIAGSRKKTANVSADRITNRHVFGVGVRVLYST